MRHLRSSETAIRICGTDSAAPTEGSSNILETRGIPLTNGDQEGGPFTRWSRYTVNESPRKPRPDRYRHRSGPELPTPCRYVRGCCSLIQKLQSISYQVDPNVHLDFKGPVYAVLVAWYVLIKAFYPFLIDDQEMYQQLEKLGKI